MSIIESFLTTHIQLNIFIIFFISIIYIVVHQNRYKHYYRYFAIVLNYIPVLTHEFGHVLFNKLSGGRAKDLVIVTLPSERETTLQQGYAITQSKGYLGQWITTLGGYIMPPLMLWLGVLTAYYNHPSFFIMFYLAIFIYFLILTSRKLSPILIIIVMSLLLYILFQYDDLMITHQIVVYSYHFILGVLLGEVLQSSWTIFKLTFQKPKPSWDGSTLTQISKIPTVFYSLVWIFINLYAVYLLIKLSFF
ncbi:M50 family metallopeptidase [Staphylococcus pasteuri]|uniref:M50 family metallopeptidase n=1 Tax=Staphylococcus TaxID=1279 RepID=UPI0008A5FD72|nr:MULTISPECIES: M50 family metallopeptidase [Staphylococcus]OFV09845.1 hypothetical protein HMPREF3125_06415 [Staphylococcus sp. HMSC13A10]